MDQIRVIDTTLRDGSHAVSHSYSPEQVRAVASELDKSGVFMIEVAHGDGISGSSYNYGFNKHNELDLIAAAADCVKTSMLDILLLPGIGNAFLVAFIEAVADFTNPVMIGGDYTTLAEHIYFQYSLQSDPRGPAAMAVV